MATFQLIDNEKINQGMMGVFDKRGFYNKIIWYLVDGSITEQDLKKINSINGKYVRLILKNTKGQNSEIIRKIRSPYVGFSVMGGLDYLHKDKYNAFSDYLERTFYTPIRLAKIIEKFESIEREIRPTWTETQKCMYVYKILAERMHYKYKNESDYENGFDVSRTLNGILADRAVCAGFALIFKEMMDRLGIECLYQNKAHSHCWNLVNLDGAWRGLDLTWDCFEKENGVCHFIYFCRENAQEFYGNPHHDISNELEEQKFALVPFGYDELKRNLDIVSNRGLKREFPTLKMGNLHLIKSGETLLSFDGKKIKAMVVPNKISFEQFKNSLNYYFNISSEYASSFNKYTRSDGSEFIILKTDSKNQAKVNQKGVYEYCLVSFINDQDGIKASVSIILSENDLINCHDNSLKQLIADNLLSPERLARKIENFNGYVGYIGPNSQMYYSKEFEEQELNIQNRK